MADITFPPIQTGTWTPIIYFAAVDITSGGIGGAVTLQGCNWGKIGPFVLITANILLTNLGSIGANDALTIGGVPFAASTTYGLSFTIWDSWATPAANTFFEGAILNATPPIIPTKVVAGVANSIVGSDVIVNSAMIISGFYMTAA